MTARGRHAPRSLRDPRAARRGRDGRGLQGAGHAARAHRRDQGAAGAVGRRPRRRASASSARRRRSRSSRIRTSARSTTSDGRARPSTSSWSFLEGETLGERLAKGALPLEQTLRYGVEIADALDKAHRQGIVHRDLKPGNVMLTKSGVKLLDFGLAKAMAPATPQASLTVAADAAGADAGRHDPRDVPVHGAGAAGGEGGRRADGHLRAGRGALRDGDGEEGVFGNEPGLADLRDPERRTRRRSPRSSRCRRRRSTASSRPVSRRIPRTGGSRPATSARSSAGSPKAPRPGSRRRLVVVCAAGPRVDRLVRFRDRRACRRDSRRRAPASDGAGARCPAGSRLHHSSRENDVSVHFRWRSAGPLAGRPEARLLGGDLRWQTPSLGTAAGVSRRAAAPRHRRRCLSLLVAGRAFRRLLRRDEAEEDRRLGWASE